MSNSKAHQITQSTPGYSKKYRYLREAAFTPDVFVTQQQQYHDGRTAL